MYRSLLVPLDGSAAAEHALPIALSLARRFAAALKIIHVHVPTWGVYGEGGVYDPLLDREIREGMQAYLDRIVQRISTSTDISLSSAVLEGLVPGAIQRHATESGVDLVVMTTQGRSPAARFWLGSVADRLVRQSAIPILLVRPREEEVDLTRETKFGHVLVPLDGSPLAEQILDPAIAIAAVTSAKITLLVVAHQFTPDDDAPDSGRGSGIRPELLKQLQEADRQERASAEKYLNELVERLKTRSLRVETRVVSHVQPATAILNEASDQGIDLIALATHGRGGLRRVLLGSVADKVLRGATTPVLVYRPVGEFVATEK
jgi:nucleotide-binding universal stress UspA family protein